MPLAISTHAANHYEATLVQLSFDFYMIAPHKRNRVRTRTQDGRRLRCYERRWLVESFFAWIQCQRILFNGGSKSWLDNAVKEARTCSEIPFSSIRAMGNLLYAKKVFEDNGIPSERITILGRSPNHAAHLQHYRKIDVALDLLPCNGTTTTFESFWMGVRVISLEGNRHAARVSASISRNLGIEELVGDNVDAYVAAARKHAMDGRKLASLRASLRNIMSGSHVMAAGKFTRNLETAY